MSPYDQRTAAFLQEMGIAPLWTLRAGAAPQADLEAEPQAQAPSVAAPVAPAAPPPASKGEGAWDDAGAVAPAATAAPAAPVPSVAPAATAPDDADAAIAKMDWAELKAAIAGCTRCAICKNKQPIHGDGPEQAAWLVTAGAASAADEKEGRALAGDCGRLLGNMLAAVGLSRGTDVYVTNLIKCRPTTASGGDRAPTLDEAMACRPYLERELALSGAPLVLTLGQIAANALQGKPLQEPLAQSRGRVHRFNGVKLVTTLHPGELLRGGADKALAWADLCLAKREHGRSD